jgi:type II secretory pathway pseudopilin PulG
MVTHSQRKQQGSTLVVVLAVFLVILVVIIGVVVSSKARNKDAAKTQTTTTAPSSQKSSTSSQPKKTTTPKTTVSTPVDSATQARNDTNTKRKADAIATAAAVRKYMNDNLGDWPDQYQNGALLGAEGDIEEPVSLQYYPDIAFVSGAQPADTYDTLVIVSSATCDAGAVTLDSTSETGLAVQYSVQQADGDFTGGCTNV